MSVNMIYVEGARTAPSCLKQKIKNTTLIDLIYTALLWSSRAREWGRDKGEVRSLQLFLLFWSPMIDSLDMMVLVDIIISFNRIVLNCMIVPIDVNISIDMIILVWMIILIYIIIPIDIIIFIYIVILIHINILIHIT